MKKKLLLLFIYMFVTTGLNAAVSLVSDAAQKTHVPVDQKVAIYYIQVQTTDDDLNLSSFTVSASGEFSFDAEAYKSVEIYQDGPAAQIGGDGVFSLIDDTMINTLTASPLNTTVSVNIAVNASQTISSTNATTGYGYWIVVELDSTKLTLDQTSTFVVNTVFASDNSKLSSIGQTTIRATGLNTTFYTNLAPDFVFPGQEEVSFLYFITEAKGENVDSLVLNISDSFNHFVDSNDEEGVDQAELFKSTLTVDAELEVRTTFNNDVGISSLLETLTYESTDWNSVDSRIIFQDQFPTLTADDKEGFWVVYDIGDNISVTSDTQINLTVDSFSGVGESSSLTIESATTNVSLTVPVAGIVVEDAQNLVSDDLFGPSTFSPMMSFKLRAYQAPGVINKINVINNGSVQFWTGKETSEYGDNVVVVELYQDADQNESFSITDDTLVGKLICNNLSSNTLTKAPVTSNITVSTYDSSRDYPLNNEVMLFVVYRFGSSIEDTNDVSGNYSTSEIGNVFVTGNYVVSGVSHSVLFKGSNSSDSSTLSSSPTSNVDFSDTTTALRDILDITPTTVYEGQEKVPMLYVEIKSLETSNQIATFEIRNSLANFYGNSTGITRVWVYRDANSSKTFDDSDTFVTSTASFSEGSTLTVSVPNIEMQEGVNRFLILYDIGSNMEGEDAAAQLNSVSITGGSSDIAGAFPAPDSVALVSDVQSKPLSSLTLDTVTVTDATVTFNLSLTLQNNSGKTVDILEYYPKFYLNDIAGLDISYEFDVVSTNPTTFSLADGLSTSVGFQVRHSSSVSQGSAVVDGSIRYTGEGDSDSILLQRFIDGNDLWKSAVSDVVTFPIETTVFINDVLPAYINEPLLVHRSAADLTFLSGSAVNSGDVMKVNFEDASGIDQGTISLIRGTDILYQSTQLEELQKYFTFDKTENQLTFYVGDESETVVLNMNDLFGNSLPTTTFRYTVSSVVELENPLFFPNPYVLGGNNLKLAFSISQPSSVSFYIYDFTGNEVFNKTQFFSNIGYNVLEISESESFVAPGVFICRILATDNDGNESVKTSKLAIY